MSDNPKPYRPEPEYKPGYYILKYRKPVPVDDVVKWGLFFNNIRNRHVRSTYLGKFHVSTVFIGLDHAFPDEELQIFETMVFDRSDDLFVDLYQTRCATWREALAMHWKAVEWVKDDCPDL